MTGVYIRELKTVPYVQLISVYEIQPNFFQVSMNREDTQALISDNSAISFLLSASTIESWSNEQHWQKIDDEGV